MGLSVLLLQLLLPSMVSMGRMGILALLLFPVIAFCLHQLTSNVWVWNRLFRKDDTVDEYELHAANAFKARAYDLMRGWPLWLSFAVLMIGGGLVERFPAFNFFASANREVAVMVFVLVVSISMDALPRIVAAVSEDAIEE